VQFGGALGDVKVKCDLLVRHVHDLLSGRIYVPPWIADGEDGQSALPPSAAIDEGVCSLAVPSAM
jgi:hypothetical protein